MGVEVNAATKVAEKNQKQMDARVREDDSIRGTNTQLIIESLRNLVKEREMMIKKRESEKRYAQGGGVGFQGGGALFEKFVKDRGGQTAFEPGFLEEILAKIGGGRERSGSEIIQDTWFNYKRELKDSGNPFDEDRLLEIEKQEKAFGEKQLTAPEPSDLATPDVAAASMFTLPPDQPAINQAAPIEKVETGPIKDAQKPITEAELEKFDRVLELQEKAASVDSPLTGTDQRELINKQTIEEVVEPEAKGPEHMPRSSNEIQDAFMEEFYERAGILPDADSRNDFMAGLKKYEDITGIRESGGNLLATNRDKPAHTATGKWQATSGNRKTNSRRIINIMGGAHNVPEWIKQGAQDMSGDEHRKFMQGLNEDQQRMLFHAQLFTQKGSDNLIKKAIESGWDEDSLTALYMGAHHLGKGKQKKTATGVPISDLYRADYRRYMGTMDK
jgi:protein-tyrosine-phosphatase